MLVSAALALVATAAAAQTRPTTIGVDEIRPGMRGYGLTVFRGTEPERFDVEVIDVLHHFRPDQHLILARTPHPVLNEAIAVGGMSGSPIYFDGRLAGAYAYGWPFGTEPVVGITPIASMFAELHRPYRPGSFPGARPLAKVRRRGQRRAAAPPPSHDRLAGMPAYRGGAVDPVRLLEGHGEHLGLLDSDGHAVAPRGLRPASTPVMLGGFTDGAAHLIGDALEPFGLVALQAGGGAGRPPGQGPAPRFVDGGAIGVSLMRGDMNATAVGTVTHVDGQRLVGFGHPMMNAGEIGLPTTTANILHIFRSQARSFKIAEALEQLGTMVHDRQSAIVVDTNLAPATIPVSIRLHGIPGAPRTEWNVEIASHRALSPVLAFTALVNALKASAADQTDVVFRAVSTVTIAGHGEVTVEDQGAMMGGPAETRALARLRAWELMEVGFGNPFTPSRIERVSIDLHLRYARDALTIVDASVEGTEVDPGGTVPVRVTLRQYDGPDLVHIVPVRIPERARGQTLEVKLQSADRVAPDRPTPTSVADLVAMVEAGWPATSLGVTLKMPSRGLRFRGHVVRALPRSALDSLQLRNATGPGRPFTTYERQIVPVGRVLRGSATLRLTVRQTPR